MGRHPIGKVAMSVKRRSNEMIADATMRHIQQAVNQIVHQADNPFYVKAWARNIISSSKKLKNRPAAKDARRPIESWTDW
jgi:hypothetical protein